MIDASHIVSVPSMDPASLGTVLTGRSADAFSAVLTRAAGGQQREVARFPLIDVITDRIMGSEETTP